MSMFASLYHFPMCVTEHILRLKPSIMYYDSLLTAVTVAMPCLLKRCDIFAKGKKKPATRPAEKFGLENVLVKIHSD